MNNWKKEKPTQEGAYWIKGYFVNNPEAVVLVRVDWYDGELCIVACDNPEEVCDYLSDWRDDFLWQGPLEYFEKAN